ncbi:MAG: flagellar motor protein MotB [Candidatus Latescibacteria bacterium]|nr:flagellar motor protein MotB [Candidatus Latescibacterota bacterium]
MAKKKKEPEGPKGAPAYMTTYGDMMTLLLCFFVLLVSFSTMEIEKFKAAAASLKGALSVLPYQDRVMPNPVQMQRPTKGEKKEKNRRRSRAVVQLRRIIRDRNLQNIVSVRENEGGVHITIGDPALFDSGKTDIKPDILPVLNQITEIIDTGNDLIRVEGHTDNVPIHTAQFRDNWDLSIGRALSVIRYMRSRQVNIDPRRLRPVGCGEFHAIAPNDTPEGRAMNRRVEIFIDFNE